MNTTTVKTTFLLLLYLPTLYLTGPGGSGGSGGASSLFAEESVDPSEEIYSQVFGQEESRKQGDGISIPITILVQDHVAGEIDAKLDDDDTVLLDRKAVLELLDPLLEEKARELLYQKLEGPSVSLTQLAAQGVEGVYDKQLLQVSLQLPPQMRKPGTLPLQNPPRYFSVESITADPFSMYLNYYGRMELLYEEYAQHDEFTLPLQVGFYPNVQLHRWVLEGGMEFVKNSDQSFDLEYLRMIKDFPAPGLRLAAGTINAAAGGSLQALPMNGISFGTEESLSTISQPYQALSREILLEEPAEVSVFLNGRLLKTARLDAGVHNLIDFPYVNGLNDIRITITGEDGQTRTIKAVVPFDSALLKKGQVNYALSAGTRENTFSDPLFSGTLSWGFFDSMTGGISFQGDGHTYIGALSTILATPIGKVGATAGISGTSGGDIGFRGQGRYRISFPARRALPSLALQFEYNDEQYRSSITRETPPDYRYRLSASLGQPLPLATYVNLSSTYAVGSGEVSDILQGTFTLLKGLGKNGSLSTYLTLSSSGQGDLEWRGSLAFSLKPSGYDQHAVYSQDLKTGKAGVSTTFNERENGLIYSASLYGYPPQTEDTTELQGGVSYSGEYLHAALTNNFSRNSNEENAYTTINRLSARIGSALLFSGGHFAFSRPVRDSFVLIVPEPEIADELLSVRSTRGSGGTKETTGGRINFSELSSYSPTSLVLELPHTPPDVVLREDMITLIPSYRSGTTITAGLRTSVYVEGSLMTLDDEPISLQAGEVLLLDAPKQKEGPEGTQESEREKEPVLFFTDEQGIFQLHDLEAGRYRLSLFSNEFARTEFTIPESADNPYRLGLITLPVVQK